MNEARAKILADFAMWTALSALRTGAPIKARGDVYPLLRATDFDTLFDPDKGPIERTEFGAWHRNAVEELQRLEPRLNIGWAAKLINVYLKTRAYVSGAGRPNLGGQLHPPIDRGLWEGLRRRFGPGSEVTRYTHCVTRIKDIVTRQCYDQIIDGCRLAAEALGCQLIEVEQLWRGTEFAVRPKMIKVVWREWDTPPTPERFGHGVVFYDRAIKDHCARVVAFLEGYAWRNAHPREVVIYCIKPSPVTPADVLSSMKERIEELIKAGRLGNGQITPRLFAGFNA